MRENRPAKNPALAATLDDEQAADAPHPSAESSAPADDAHRPRYALVVMSPKVPAGLHHLLDDGEVTLGRAPECTLPLDDARLSRKHAVLRRAGDVFEIIDCDSMNGTFVGDERLAPGVPRRLRLGEAVSVGSATLVVQYAVGGERPPSPQHAPAAPAKLPVVQGRAMSVLMPLVDKLARSDISVLLLGETGVGKEVFARMIHERSPRASTPMVCLNCASLSEALLESELFGYEKGAFTGATAPKVGLLEAASGGVAFLDEVGEMPLALQAKMLRVLEQREVLRVGAVAPRPIDVRFICATNRDLGVEIEQGRFRQDLYFRLNGFTLAIPPLRQRVDEIEPLARRFVAVACARAGVRPLDITPEAIEALVTHEWPGNVRELKNVMDRAVLLSSGAAIDVRHVAGDRLGRLPARATQATAPPRREVAPRAAFDLEPETSETSPDDAERRRIVKALEDCAGNQTRAAQILGISRRHLVTKIETFNIPRPRKRS